MKKLSVVFLLTVISTSSMAAVKRCPLHYRPGEEYKNTILFGVSIDEPHVQPLSCIYADLDKKKNFTNAYAPKVNTRFRPDEAQVVEKHWSVLSMESRYKAMCQITTPILMSKNFEAARDYCRFTEEAA